MNRKMSSMEAKIDAKKPDETVYNLLAKIDGALDNVDDKVDDQELRLDSMKRAMERLHEANRKEWESFNNLEKKIEKMDLVMRRIFGFHKSLEHLSAQQAEVSKGLQSLLDLAYPPDSHSGGDDEDETRTQYDNKENLREKLGRGPPPSLFTNPDLQHMRDRNPAIKGLNIPINSEYVGSSFSPPSVPSVPVISGPVLSLTSNPVDTEPETMSLPIVEPLVRLSPAPPSTVESPIRPISPPKGPSPDITMTNPTPVHSQDDDQVTRTIASNNDTVEPPSQLPPSSNYTYLALPTDNNSKGNRSQGPSRRSPRFQTPTPTDHGSKRPPEDEEGGDAKRRKVVPP